MATPLMPKATAVWLIDNTTLTFEQVANCCQLHELEVQAIADGEVAIGIQGLDPVAGSLGPTGDGALGDRLAELREQEVGHDGHPCSDRPVSESTVSPKSSLNVGWGWMNAATSSTVASQLTAM